jgi:hypothetical protein
MTDAVTVPAEFRLIAAICTATDVVIGSRTVLGIDDARDLHQGLGVGTDYTTWIKGRIQKYGFQAAVDYEVSQSRNLGTGGRGPAFPFPGLGDWEIPFCSPNFGSKDISPVSKRAKGVGIADAMGRRVVKRHPVDDSNALDDDDKTSLSNAEGVPGCMSVTGCRARARRRTGTPAMWVGGRRVRAYFGNTHFREW